MIHNEKINQKIEQIVEDLKRISDVFFPPRKAYVPARREGYFPPRQRQYR